MANGKTTAKRSRVTCLIGNGASIAFEPKLALPELTREVICAFAQANTNLDHDSGADEANGATADAAAAVAHAALSAFANAIVGTSTNNGFEQLLSPLDAAARALPALRALQGLRDAAEKSASDEGAETVEALKRSEAFLHDLHRLGMSLALEIIDKRTNSSGKPRFEQTIQALADKLFEAVDHPGDLTIATLNYDPLLHRGCFERKLPEGDASGDYERDRETVRKQITDLADGRPEQEKYKCPGDYANWHQARRLRTSADFLPGRAVLLQLHGSLAWLREPGSGEVWRFEMNDLRKPHFDMVDGGSSFWEAWRDERTEWEPVVVLTDQKDRAVQQSPFDLAYQAFARRLSWADRWLIAGYGFGDEPVNVALQDAVRWRRAQCSSLPRILVVDRREDHDELRDEVGRVLGLEGDEIEQHITVECRGIPECLETSYWCEWSDDYGT